MLLQAVWLLHRSSEPLRLRANAGNIAFTIAGSAAGVMLLARLWYQRPATVAQLIELVAVVSVVTTQLLRPTPRPQVGRLWTSIAMSFSGLSGTGGPPLVLWSMAHDWSSDRMRTTLWLLFTPRAPFLLALMYLNFSTLVLKALLLVLFATPLLWAGSALGFRLGDSLTAAHLRPVATGVLLLTGASAILRPLLIA